MFVLLVYLETCPIFSVNRQAPFHIHLHKTTKTPSIRSVSVASHAQLGSHFPMTTFSNGNIYTHEFAFSSTAFLKISRRTELKVAALAYKAKACYFCEFCQPATIQRIYATRDKRIRRVPVTIYIFQWVALIPQISNCCYIL